MQTLENDNLKEIIKGIEKPILVDFYADWCGPCKMIGPIIDELANEYDEKLEIIKINVDTNPLSAAAFGIRSIPTLVVFDKGELVKRHAGAIPKSKIVELFDKFLV